MDAEDIGGDLVGERRESAVEGVEECGSGTRVREQRESERARAFAKAWTRQARCRRCWVTMRGECELQIGTPGQHAYRAVIRLSSSVKLLAQMVRCLSTTLAKHSKIATY